MEDKKSLLSRALEGSGEAINKLVHFNLVDRSEMEAIRIKGKTKEVRELAARFLRTKTEQQKRRRRQIVMALLFLAMIFAGWKVYPKIESWFLKQTTETEIPRHSPSKVYLKDLEEAPTKILKSPEVNKERILKSVSFLEDSARRRAQVFANHYGVVGCDDLYFNSDRKETEWINAMLRYKGDTINGSISFIRFQGAIVVELTRVKYNYFAGTWQMMSNSGKLEGVIREKYLDLTFYPKTKNGIAKAKLHKIR